MNGRNVSYRSSANESVEYEMQLNEVLPRDDDPVICTYDANLLNPDLARSTSCARIRWRSSVAC